MSLRNSVNKTISIKWKRSNYYVQCIELDNGSVVYQAMQDRKKLFTKNFETATDAARHILRYVQHEVDYKELELS